MVNIVTIVSQMSKYVELREKRSLEKPEQSKDGVQKRRSRSSASVAVCDPSAHDSAWSTWDSEVYVDDNDVDDALMIMVTMSSRMLTAHSVCFSSPNRWPIQHVDCHFTTPHQQPIHVTRLQRPEHWPCDVKYNLGSETTTDRQWLKKFNIRKRILTTKSRECVKLIRR